MSMLGEIKKILKKAAGKEIGQVLISEKPEFGNYSTNAAFLLATLRRAQGEKISPADIAKELAEKVRAADGGKLFSKVEAAGGYVNFWISVGVLAEELSKILKQKKYPTSHATPPTINLEFVSANPTGPLTMANGRGGFLGDTLANVLKAVGHKVVREYYINDAGNQIRLLGDSILAVLGKVLERDEHYQGAYIKDLAENLKKEVEKGKKSEEIGREAAKILLADIKESIKSAGINFDVFFSEYKNLRKGNGIKRILEILEKRGLVEKKAGAIWLKTSDIAGDKDRVLVKSDGQPTYFLADLAYHYDKFIKRKFNLAIDIWGADHHGYVARLKSGVKALGIDSNRLKIIITQLVRLVEGGKEARMSKRKGEFVTLDELIEKLGGKPPFAKASAGKDAARFFFLMHAPESHMDFDLALAKERSLKNPVYYAQYAYVRAFNILKRANLKFKILNLKLLTKESEMNLLAELVKFPQIIRQTAEDYQVHRLTRYAMELARAVHNFYEKERVIGAPKEEMEPRLALVAATATILKRLFDLIGIEAPKRM